MPATPRLRHLTHRTHRFVLLALAALLLVNPLAATWSIIIVNTRTGEVGVASATCVPGYDLRQLTPVVLVGVGGAAAQSYVDGTGQNRVLMFSELAKGTDPAQILMLLAQRDPGHQTRQYGIVDTKGRAVGFTGTGAGAYASHLTGSAGDLVWAIQGNVITGQPVLAQAEQAIRNTAGDLPAKLMAAMEAARLMGGDGRCSCLSGPPPSCGSPPPQFTKTAHIGYVIVARQGDTDGTCNGVSGCATGRYYLNLNVPNRQLSDPDPVFLLKSMYDQWRLTWLGRPDHHLSTVDLSRAVLPADGSALATARITLHDWQGARIAGSNAKVTVTLEPSSTAGVQIGAVLPQGGGVYTVPLTAGTTAGTAHLRITVDDGKGAVLLSPRTAIEVSDAPLWASAATVPAFAGGVVDFVLQGSAARAGRPYALLGSASGSTPGFRIGAVTVPLNPDPFLSLSAQLANSWILPHSAGMLDASGRAQAGFVVAPGVLLPALGLDLTWAWATLNPIDFASNPVTVRIVQ